MKGLKHHAVVPAEDDGDDELAAWFVVVKALRSVVPYIGGHDNVRELVDLWFGPQYRAIGPSRSGYLGSRMSSSARIPNSRLVTIEAGGHLFLHHAAEVREATTAFITQVSPEQEAKRSDDD